MNFISAALLLATMGASEAAFDINYRADSPVNSRIALAVLTENTIIWYDHWEDGYDFPSGSEHKYSGHALSSTTEIWGDDDCSNGHAPGYCTRENPHDILHSGDSIVIEDEVPVPTSGDYNPGDNIKYDGRDKVLATFPIAMVRGAYPGGSPGSMMAGAVEVLETNDWGKTFTSPVGQDTGGSGTSAFEQTMFYVMAKDDDTHCVFYSNTGNAEKSFTLNEGEAYNRRMYKRGNYLECTKDVQVDLVTGDEDSNYELRWFSLLPTEDWSESYFSPVGDSKGNLRVLVSNPNDWDIEVTVETRSGSKSDMRVRANDIAYSNYIGDSTGAAVYTNGGRKAGKFLCLSLTDTYGSGHIWDWGFPVMPTHKLTSEVIVGWGYGCTSQNCAGGQARSVVWVSPVEKADIYVSFNSDDKVDLMFQNVRRLENKEVTNGSDLSGAKIWAVKPNADKNSVDTVLIAAAWGQDAQRTVSGDYQALDMGTLVPPLASVRVTESVKLVTDVNGDEKINPGDWIEYTIEVKNAGTFDYAAGAYFIANAGMADNLPFQTYKGSCTFKDHNGNTNYNCNDNALTTANGHASPAPLPKGGSSHYYTFLAQVGTDVETTDISNNGILRQPRYGKDLPFSVPEKVHYEGGIELIKTVHEGSVDDCEAATKACVMTGRSSRGGDSRVSERAEVSGSNSGKSSSKKSSSKKSSSKKSSKKGSNSSSGSSADGSTGSSADGSTGSSADGSTGSSADGSSTDSASGSTSADGSSSGSNSRRAHRVLGSKKGDKKASKSDKGEEMYTESASSTLVTYCYSVTNTGASYLDTIKINDNEINMPEKHLGKPLAPGESAWVKFESEVGDDVVRTTAHVSGKPVMSNGDDIETDVVEDVDEDGIECGPEKELPEEPTSNPSVEIKKTIHLATLASCFPGQDIVHGYKGKPVTYCYEVINTGDVALNVVVTDLDPSLPVSGYDTIAPGESTFVKHYGNIDGDQQSDGKVHATPLDGNESVEDQDGAMVQEMARTTCVL